MYKVKVKYTIDTNICEIFKLDRNCFKPLKFKLKEVWLLLHYILYLVLLNISTYTYYVFDINIYYQIMINCKIMFTCPSYSKYCLIKVLPKEIPQ